MFEIEISNSASRFIEKAEKILQERLLAKMEKLQREPFPHDCKRVVGREEKLFRVRVGDYRILYLIDYEKNKILVADIDKRARVYG